MHLRPEVSPPAKAIQPPPTERAHHLGERAPTTLGVPPLGSKLLAASGVRTPGTATSGRRMAQSPSGRRCHLQRDIPVTSHLRIQLPTDTATNRSSYQPIHPPNHVRSATCRGRSPLHWPRPLGQLWHEVSTPWPRFPIHPPPTGATRLVPVTSAQVIRARCVVAGWDSQPPRPRLPITWTLVTSDL